MSNNYSTGDGVYSTSHIMETSAMNTSKYPVVGIDCFQPFHEFDELAYCTTFINYAIFVPKLTNFFVLLFQFIK